MNSHFHFLGICGTAMGAVAAAMARRGFTVTGSDANVYPPMSTFLEEEGITLFEGYKASNIPPDADVIVIGNAMSRGNEEVEAVLQRRLRYLSLPETMKEYFLRGKRNYVVTGTHGKTTTTSMLAWLMPAISDAGAVLRIPIFPCWRGTSTTRRFSTSVPNSCTTSRNWWSSTTLNLITRIFTIPWRKSN